MYKRTDNNQKKLVEQKKYRYFVGIDTGCNTGVAVWDKENKKLQSVETMPIHKALEMVNGLLEWNYLEPDTFIRIEDARKRKWFGARSDHKVQGAGSIKRDAKIWEDFLNDLKVDFEMVAPKNNKTKMNAESFKKITGWQGKTNEHGRDAAMLVYGF